MSEDCQLEQYLYVFLSVNAWNNGSDYETQTYRSFISTSLLTNIKLSFKSLIILN